MDPFVAKVSDTVRRHDMLTGRERVLVAVSGGADSVSLLAALAGLGFEVVAAHVNHGLRGGDSTKDERFVRRLGARLGVEVVALEGAIEPGPNLEERARERRYACLLEAARSARCRRIATAHTRDDQAETVLLRLIRGSGTAGLGAMAPVREDGVIRPLLETRRDEVRAYLRRAGLRFRSDRTNRELRFTRNRVRRRLLPLLEREFNPAVREALARAAELLREDERHLAHLASLAVRRLRRGTGLDAPALRRLSPAIGRRVVRAWLEERRGTSRALEASHVEGVLDVAGGTGRAISIPGGTVRRSGNEIRWEASGAAAPLPYRRRIEPGRPVVVAGWRIEVRRERGRGKAPSRWRAVFDAGRLGDAPLVVRSPAPGARIRPLGLGGSRKLQDVFVDAKVAREERGRWPVLTAGPIVIWVPGLVRSAEAPVSPATRDVIVLEALRARESRDVAAKNPMCYGRSRRRKASSRGLYRRRRKTRKEPI